MKYSWDCYRTLGPVVDSDDLPLSKCHQNILSFVGFCYQFWVKSLQVCAFPPTLQITIKLLIKIPSTSKTA